MRDALDRAGELARQALHAEVTPAVHAEGRERIVAAAVNRRFPRRGARFRIAAAVLAAAAILLAFGLANYRRPLGYTVDGAAHVDSNYLGAPANKPAEVRFDDGSSIRAEPGTRLRIDESYVDGARVLLERGGATAHVAHGRTTRWRFDAGPFAVHVTGTRFTLSWEPVTEEVELTLHEGSVEVESPLSAGRLAVRAGQRFRASLPNGSMQVEAAARPVSSAAAPSNAEDSSDVLAEHDPRPGAAAASPPLPSARSAQEPAPSWPELVRNGKFAAVVEAAEARGIESTLSTASARELRALADAARYGGETALAERTLGTVRSRFAGSRDASAAALLLGRIRESAGDLAGADRWYESYLTEAPGGELAADALAGRMRLAATLRGGEAARALAREYLTRYPRGVHAARAKKIVGHE
jgi:hypothetical protein